jgi:phospholipid/cholesterol/gamma-HCH transport system substrate-binding protein
MRSRSTREGSVGLLALVGISVFALVVFWLRGIRLAGQSYQITVTFPSAAGMQIGTPVRYRGVKVGRIIDIDPGTNQVDVVLEIAPPDLVIPKNVVIQANQAGLLSEGFVDIYPQGELPSNLTDINPLSPDCPETVLCHNSRLQGNPGIGFETLMESMYEFSELYSNPEFFSNVNGAAAEVTVLAQEATVLAAKMSKLVDQAQVELNSLSQSVDTGITTFSTELNAMSNTLQQSTNDVVQATIVSARSVEVAASEIIQISEQINQLIANNRGTLVTTLDNINQTTAELNQIVNNLSPIVSQVEQGNIIENLEQLSRNAVEASANLNDLTQAVNAPENLILLQETIDAARSTLQNLEKITSDVDDFTGDPRLRESLKNIINGLGNILTSTQALEQQTAIAEATVPLSEIVQSSQAVYQIQSSTLLQPLIVETDNNSERME